MIGVYKISNHLREVYIGSSINVEKRIDNHKKNSSNKKLKESIKKYGLENHKIEILCECNKNELHIKETEYIDKYKSIGVVFNERFVINGSGGRKKSENITIPIRCYEAVIKDVRKYAKEQSEKYLEELIKQK